MDAMEEKLNAILGDPDTMQKIMSMAQNLGLGQPEKEEQPKQGNPLPELDLGMLQKFSGLARQGSVDKEQQALLHALRPYLSNQRIRKLENAMRAAKMAKVAAVAFSQQGAPFSSGR